MNAIIGIDIGTTNIKIKAYTHDGKVVAEATYKNKLDTSKPNMAESDPNEILNDVKNGITLVNDKLQTKDYQLIGISFSVAMHSLIVEDANHKLLTNMITWADNRASDAAHELKKSAHAKELYQRTGIPIHPMTPFVKLVWLSNDHPEIVDKAAYFLDIKTFLLQNLTGEFVMDYSIGSATGLFNSETLSWDPLALKLAEIKPVQLPTLVDTTTQLNLLPGIASSLKLDPTVPLIIGAGDGPLANLGLGAIHPGNFAVTIGTSGAVRAGGVNTPTLDPDGRLFCYYLAPGEWVVGGAVNNGGNVLQWLVETIYNGEIAEMNPTDPYNWVLDQIAEIPAGAHGVLFYPYLNGERAPMWESAMRGAFLGLSSNQTQWDLGRAALEGILMNLKIIELTLEKMLGDCSTLLASGGFTQSEFWSQMLADVFDHPISFPETGDSSALGAVRLAMLSLGKISSLDEFSPDIGQTLSPKSDAKVYATEFPVWETVGHSVVQNTKVIAQYQKKLSD